MFRRVAVAVSKIMGMPATFIAALCLIGGWGVSGFIFHFSDTWQLTINTTTSIMTFLMVFVIQNTQNRDTTAMHLKLDEIIKASRGARNYMVDVEELTDEELHKLQEEFKALHEQYSHEVTRRQGRER